MKVLKLLLVFSSLAYHMPSFAQWTTSDNNIYNSNSGNVGIGTTSPTGKLSVQGAINVGNTAITSNILTASDGDPGASVLTVSRQTGNVIKFQPFSGGGFNFAGGNVGIDVGSPQYKLDVSGIIRTDNSILSSAGFYYNADTKVLNLTGITGSGSTLNIERSTTAINNFIRMYDVATGGQILLGGGSSNGFLPKLFFKPDGSTWKHSAIISETPDAGSYAAIVLDGRKSGGPLTTQDVLSVGSYTTTHLRVKANGNVAIINGLLHLASKTTDYTGEAGGMYYNSSNNQFKGYRNGAWKNFLMEGDAAVTNGWSLIGNTGTSNNFIGTLDAQPLVFKTNNAEALRITATGQLAIGTTIYPSHYKLAVGGNIIAERVKVKAQAGWPDYVFESQYPLLPLQELQMFIAQNKHLPGIPSAEEMKKEDGIDLGDMNTKLLEKVEELTLYLIKADKRIEELENKIEKLEKKK